MGLVPASEVTRDFFFSRRAEDFTKENAQGTLWHSDVDTNVRNTQRGPSRGA